MHSSTPLALLALLALLILPLASSTCLGTANLYSVLAHTLISNDGTSTINGRCGVSAAGAITGAPCTSPNTDLNTPVAAAALADCGTAYTSAYARSITATLGPDLGGTTLTPGVYDFTSSAVVIGAGTTLTLILGSPTDTTGQFVFKVVSTFMTGNAAAMVLGPGVQACNVFFLVGSSATLADDVVLKGNVLAYTSITVGKRLAMSGLLCAQNGAVTLDSDVVAAQTACQSPAVMA